MSEQNIYNSRNLYKVLNKMKIRDFLIIYNSRNLYKVLNQPAGFEISYLQ